MSEKPSEHDKRVHMGTIRRWATAGTPFSMLTCYDATTAGWLWRAGVRTLLVGDTAAQMVLGYDSTLPAPLDFMVQITAGVRRGAPSALVMADMPFGSYQCGDDQAVANAMRFMAEGMADVVKLEVDRYHEALVERMTHAGVAVVGHVGCRPQHVRQSGFHKAAGRTQRDADRVVEDALAMLRAGCVMLLVEAVPAEVGAEIVELASSFDSAGSIVPVIGCGAGPACHGHVIVLQDLLGLTSRQPPFARPMGETASALSASARAWVELVESGEYLAKDHPYVMQSDAQNAG